MLTLVSRSWPLQGFVNGRRGSKNVEKDAMARTGVRTEC